MFKSKSFRINHEIDKKPKVHELLYETKRLRWLKFLIIPLLIAFSLLLVLSNVNFSGESYELVVAPTDESQTVAGQMPTTAVMTIVYVTPTKEVGLDGGKNVDEEKADADSGKAGDVGIMEVGDTAAVAVQNWNEAVAVVSTKYSYFNCTDNHTCNPLICTGGPIYNIFSEIEYYLKWCENTFDVIIENCTFSQNTIGEYTFSGNFKMTTLAIRNCQLDTIVDNAFKQRSVSELKNLTFDGVQLRLLNAQTFNGLETVEKFQLFNVVKAGSPLKANNFLQPMAASLNSVVLQQSDASGNPNVIYNPTGWLGGSITTVYSKLLYVDLSGTNFNDNLNVYTFAKLSAVQELRLANCSLSTIAANVFQGILSTLKSLDLRSNQLRTLDGAFLATAVAKGISIELGWNLWSCDCDNVEIVEYMKQIEHNSAAETVCATPTELQGTQIRDAQMRCDGTTMLTTTITTLITTAATRTTTSTIKTTTGDDTTKETAETMDPISSSISSSYYTTLPTSAATTITTATTEITDVSESTDVTSPSTINTTHSPTTTTNSSLMTSTIEGDTTLETTESTATTTPQLTSTTLIIFPSTTIIPIPKTTETTKTTAAKTTIEAKTTTNPPATIPPATTTCFRNKSPKFLVCSDIIAIKLCDYDATFNVVPITTRSVQLQIGENANDLQAIYFQEWNKSINEENALGNNSRIVIDSLTPNSSYIFCLIPKEQTSTSPFNCRSAHLPIKTAETWLEQSDIALFCTIVILITVICVAVGLAVIYYLLRWRPTLLYGNKRLRRIASTTHEVLLFPKADRTSVDSKTHALNELSKMHSSASDTLTPENYLNIKSYDYMQYFKNTELAKQRKVAHISLNQPPVHRAPALPPNVVGAAMHRDDRVNYFSGYLPVRPISQQSTVVLEDVPLAQSTRGVAPARLCPEPVEVLENEYESLDYYQELY